MRTLIERWRDDPGSTYRTWFLWEKRLKNFRSIRRGLSQVVDEIEKGSFGNVYKGSSLETVVGSIAEQRQIFKGADHAFLWKPKLRIPDIYESPENQRAFGAFLNTCCYCSREDDILRRRRSAWRPLASRAAVRVDRLPCLIRGPRATQSAQAVRRGGHSGLYVAVRPPKTKPRSASPRKNSRTNKGVKSAPIF